MRLCAFSAPAPYLLIMLPYLFAHDEKKRWNVYFLTAACLSSIFTDFNSVPVLAVAWPAFFLIFAAGTQKKWYAVQVEKRSRAGV